MISAKTFFSGFLLWIGLTDLVYLCLDSKEDPSPRTKTKVKKENILDHLTEFMGPSMNLKPLRKGGVNIEEMKSKTMNGSACRSAGVLFYKSPGRFPPGNPYPLTNLLFINQ